MQRNFILMLGVTSRFVFPLALAFVLASLRPALAADTVTWDDLVPDTVVALAERAARLEQRFDALATANRERYLSLAHERRVNEASAPDSPGGELRDSASSDADAIAFWQEVDAVNAELAHNSSAVVATLDGRKIRLPGYVLPLELAQQKVREFLLVPYVGACIHTPPPPANQIVHVNVPKGFESRGLYAPVWVEGTMKVRQADYRVSFVDGSDSVMASYALSATAVSDYDGN